MDLYLDGNNQFVPGFIIVCDPDKIKPDGIHGAPDLVAEVLLQINGLMDFFP